MRKSGPFFPPPQAPVWSMVGWEGSVVLVGAAAGPPGTYIGIHITEHPGPLAPGRQTAGHLRKRGLLSPGQAATEKQLPTVFPLP